MPQPQMNGSTVYRFMQDEITFDCYYPDDSSDIEGCYRLSGADWLVFYFTKDYDGQPEIRRDAVWRSGITGINVQHPKDEILNTDVVKRILQRVLGARELIEVTGPNSLQLK